VYLRGWRSHRARLNELTEALSSGSLPTLRLFENYYAQLANFQYQLGEVCFNRSDGEILELFAFLDCKAISASLEKHLEQHPTTCTRSLSTQDQGMCFPVIFLLLLPTRSVALSWHAGLILPDARGLTPITFDSQFFAGRLALPIAYSRANLQLTNAIIAGAGSPAAGAGSPAAGAVLCLVCDVRIANSSISECSAARGDALRLTSSWFSLCGVTFSGCETTSDGGAIDCSAPPSVAISRSQEVKTLTHPSIPAFSVCIFRPSPFGRR
jgi:hypothetical protein